MRNYDYKHRRSPLPTRGGIGTTEPLDGGERRGRGTDPQRHFPDTATSLVTPRHVFVDLEGGGQRQILDARD